MLAAQSQATPFDSIWANPDASATPLSQLDLIMLADDKILVVLAVLLLVWIGLMLLTWRTDKHLDALERRLEDGINDDDPL